MAEHTARRDWLGSLLACLLVRFPWAVLAAVLFAGYFILGLHRPSEQAAEEVVLRIVRIPAGLTAAFLWSLIVALFAEARGLTAVARHGLTVAGLAVIAVLVVTVDRLDVQLGMIVGSLLLAVGFAPYLRHGSSDGAFWRFNHDLWVGFLASAVAAVLFGIGLSAIVETLRYLFGSNISYTVHERIWAVATGLAGPLYWASVIPEDFAPEVEEGPPKEFVSRMVALLVKFILVPLLLIYAVILHVYAVKIGIDMALPKGRLGWLVLCFGSLTALTALLAYPTRLTGGAIVTLFWRLWPWLLVVPLVMLFIAVGVRIKAYGVTEGRYFVVLLGLWLAVAVASHAIGRRGLRWLPGTLAALTLTAALGPWGIHGWSTRSQLAELTRALDTAGLLRDGRIKPGEPAPLNPNAPEAQKLSNLVYYFSNRNRLHLLRPHFAGDAADPFTTIAHVPGQTDWRLAEAIRKRLGIVTAHGDSGTQVTYSATRPRVVALGSDDYLLTEMTVNNPGHSPGHSQPRPRDAAVEVGRLSLSWRLEDRRLVVEDAVSKQQAVFDLSVLDAADGPFRIRPDAPPIDGPPPRQPKAGPADVPARPAQQRRSPPITLERSEGDLPATLYVTNVNGQRQTERGLVVTYLGGMLRVKAPPR